MKSNWSKTDSSCEYNNVAYYYLGLVVINFSFKFTGSSLPTTAGYIDMASISNYAPSKAVFFRGCVSGMVLSYSGKLTSGGVIQGYHDPSHDYSRLGAYNHGTIVYYRD